jgi:hypothetical protein
MSGYLKQKRFAAIRSRLFKQFEENPIEDREN